MAEHHYTLSEPVLCVAQPNTGKPCSLRPGFEPEIITCLRVVERLEVITAGDMQNYTPEDLQNKLKSCQQQHEELARWVRELIVEIPQLEGS